MGAVLILGSATPSVETFWRSRQGDVHLLALPERVGPELLATDGSRESTALELPRVDVVDMRLELHRGNTSLLSVPLQELLVGTLRRKSRPFCSSIGAGWRPSFSAAPVAGVAMSVFLVYHQDRERLVCHRCDYREAPRRSCPTCGGTTRLFRGGNATRRG